EIVKRTIQIWLAAALLLMGCCVDVFAQTIKVGAVVPLTGRYASVGNDRNHGYDIAVERINAGGGIQVGNRRVPVELMVLDDESDAPKTVARLETQATQGVLSY